MTQNTQLVAVQKVKSYLATVDVKSRLQDMLGRKAPAFMSSIVQIVAGSKQLQQCDPNSIMSAAFVAASFDLPIDPNLGFSAIVPYKGKAQFQMMYRGFIQLAIRTGQYRSINASEVYADEILSYNPITKECQFVNEFKSDSFRAQGNQDKIVGYYSYFELVNGFRHQLYMTIEEVENHAKQYSQSYGYDLRENKKSSKWSTDFGAMAIKTVIKLLLSKWGILSIDMQRAISDDQKVYGNEGGEYVDNPDTLERVPDPFEDDGTPCSKNHVDTINKIVKSLNVDYPILDDFLLEYNVTKLDELTQAQAQKVIESLAKKMDEKGGE